MKQLPILVLSCMAFITCKVSAGQEPVKLIEQVDFSHVYIQDAFWSPRLEKHITATLPVCIDQIENQTGRIQNFENAAKGTGKHSGIFFDDSDVYKALEGIAYALINHPDPALEKKADQWIAKMAAAQQPDGYINTFYTLTGLGKRWTNMDKHEMYCAGHMIEAAVAYYKATGKRQLLDVSIRMADHMMSVFGPGKRNWVPGHEEIELALVKLFQTTGERKYLDFSNWLLEQRGHGYGSMGDEGTWNPVYYQDDKPIREMTDIAGHAVRCMYLYCGMADVAAYKHETSYIDAMNRLWDDVVLRNMYITGGIGSSKHNEGFTEDYDLPNKEAYCETCASVGMVFWNQRMNQFTGDSKYIDVLERSMYNGALSGISLAGDLFFYVNPLESDGDHHRKAWYGCACCPSQISRFLPSIGNYIYGVSKDALWVNLYIGNKTDIPVGKNKIEITQKTDYPWNGDIRLVVNPDKNIKKQIRLRIPEWSETYTIRVNGKEVKARVEKGYAVIDNQWKKGDEILLSLDMKTRVVAADERVKANVGKRAIQRGPLVYCMEETDNKASYNKALITDETALKGHYDKSLLNGVYVIDATDGNSSFRMIPYYAWDNREAGKMKVWIDYGPGSAVKGDNLYSENYLNNRYPLLKKPYIKLPLGSIKPKGWMRQQLEIMRDGMTGNLDVVYEKVMGKRNGWLGGDGDVWERGPYWIDGLLPLAYILEDKRLIEKVKPWIEWTLASQKADGYFGQDTDRPNEPGLQRDNAMDWWPKMVMLKVMQQYYSATGDQRVIQFLDNYFRYQLKQLPSNPLDKWTFWGYQRGGDNLMIVYWLYNITGEKYLLDLGELIHKQTFNWTDIFLNQNHLSRQHSLHCVNLAQGFKEPVVYYQQSKDYKHLEAVDKAVSVMRHTIGLPTGLWAGDELLRFGNPVYGSELCTAVEMMFSLEEILEVTGNTHWADYLERIAYNVLPTQVTDTYSARQYYQQVNQVSVTRNWRDFTTPHDDTDILFGELTGYPCCTSNLHQGWPKMVQNLIYATGDNGVAALVYAPCEAKVKVGDGKTLLLREETNYPFDEAIAFHFGFEDKKVKESFFPFRFRVPAWCTKPDIRLNGEKLSLDTQPGEIVSISRNWKTGDVLNVEFPAQVDISYWYDGGAVVERGPLLYALKMNEKWEKKNIEKEYVAKYGSWYFEVTSDSPWNYAFMKKNLQKESLPAGFIVEKKALKDGVYPWNVDNAPLQIRTKANRIPSWTLYRGSAGPIPFNTQQGKDYTDTEETIELIPYGCTTLRIAQFPVR